MNSQKRNHLRSVNPRTFTLALEIPELQMTCAWGGIPGFVCLPRDPLLALVRDGYLVGPDVAVLDVLQFPEIAHKWSSLCHPAVFMFIKGKEEILEKCKNWILSRLLCGGFYFEIKYFKYFQIKLKTGGGLWYIGSHAINLLYRQILLIKFILINFMYLIG